MKEQYLPVTLRVYDSANKLEHILQNYCIKLYKMYINLIKFCFCVKVKSEKCTFSGMKLLSKNTPMSHKINQYQKKI